MAGSYAPVQSGGSYNPLLNQPKKQTNQLGVVAPLYSGGGLSVYPPPAQTPTAPTLDFSKSFSSVEPAGGTGTLPTFNQYFNGTLYTDENAYKNAVLADAQVQYDRNLKTLNNAYQNGLISFDERENLIKQNRQNIQKQSQDLTLGYQNNIDALGRTKQGALENQAGFFAAVAPDAVQSAQTTMADKTQQEYQRGVDQATLQKTNNDMAIEQSLQGADQALADTGRERATFNMGYENNLAALEGSKTQASDAINQGVLDFQNKRASAYTAAKANTTQYDPTDVLKSLAGLYIQNEGLGIGDSQNKANIASQLAKTKLSNEEQSQILNYLYGSFIPTVKSATQQ